MYILYALIYRQSSIVNRQSSIVNRQLPNALREALLSQSKNLSRNPSFTPLTYFCIIP